MVSKDDRVYKVGEFNEVGTNQLFDNSFGTQNYLDTELNPNGNQTIPGGGSGGGGNSGGVGRGNVLAIDPYTSPYIQPRRVFFTLNTFTNLSKIGVVAKAYIDGVEVEEQSNSKGKITFSLNEQRLLNPSVLTLVSGDLKPQKYFIIQSRKDVENQVSVIEISTMVDPVASDVLNVPVFAPNSAAGGGGAGSTTGGGATEVTAGQYRNQGAGFADGERNRENAQQ